MLSVTSCITSNIRYGKTCYNTQHKINASFIQFTGDSVKGDVERIVRQLRNPLQIRLRFIAQVQLKVEDMVSMSAMKPGQGQIGQSKVAPKEENVLMKQDFN